MLAGHVSIFRCQLFTSQESPPTIRWPRVFRCESLDSQIALSVCSMGAPRKQLSQQHIYAVLTKLGLSIASAMSSATAARQSIWPHCLWR